MQNVKLKKNILKFIFTYKTELTIIKSYKCQIKIIKNCKMRTKIKNILKKIEQNILLLK